MQSGFGPGGGQPPGYPPAGPGAGQQGWGIPPTSPSQQNSYPPAQQPPPPGSQQPAFGQQPAYPTGAQPFGSPSPIGAPPGDPMGYGQVPAAPMTGYGVAPQPMMAAAAMPMLATGPQYGQYEFTDTENAVVNRLAGRLMAAGIIQIIFGALGLVFNFVGGISTGIVGIPGAIALVVVGALFLSASGSFRQIARTQGNDMAHLMQAMDKMASAALVQIIGYIVAVVLGAIILLLVVVLFAAFFASL